MNTTATPMIKRFCRRKQVMCEYANELAYCKVTACAYPSCSPNTWTSDKTDLKGENHEQR